MNDLLQLIRAVFAALGFCSLQQYKAGTPGHKLGVLLNVAASIIGIVLLIPVLLHLF